MLVRLACLLTLWLAIGCAHVARAPSAPSIASFEHPLMPLDAAEIGRVFALVTARFDGDPALPKERLRIPFLALAEPPKAEVLAWKEGQPFSRRAEVHVLHAQSNRTFQLVVDLRAGAVTSLEVAPAGTQPAVSVDEYELAEQRVREHPAWRSAVERRGVDPDRAYLDVWAPGEAELPAEAKAQLSFGEHTRLLRALTFDGGPADASAPHDPYARPVEGVVVTIDMNAGKVVHVSDSDVRPVIAESGIMRARTVLEPLVTTQPDGSDLTLRGRLVTWHDWRFYVVLHPREGLVLYDVKHRDGDVWRAVAYRLSLSEIYVPYGFGSAEWVWRSAFDLGEYNAGTLSLALTPNRDVPDHATLLDAVLFTSRGPTPENPTGTRTLPAAIALYERDAGMLWTRVNPKAALREGRLARELVATWSCVIGNYVYGFDWVFKLDGSIAVNVQLTGATLNRGADKESEASAPKVGVDARGVAVAAPNHQHFFSFRLDLDVDGPDNHVMEMEVAHLKDTGFGNSFDAVTQHIAREGQRDPSPETVRHWHVESAHAKNALGKPTGYALDPGLPALPYSAPDFAGLTRARFAQHALWMTRQHEGELYAAGLFPNQARGEDGVSRFVRDGESLEGEDVVLWYTTGLTHLPRPEDYPVMPTETIGFRLAPRGFFARNPALDVADQASER